MRLIVFDCTRLVRRLEAPTPTGIDRVDFRYLRYFLANSDRFQLHAVAMKAGNLHAIDTKLVHALFRSLETAWGSRRTNETQSSDPQASPKQTKIAISRQLKRARLVSALRTGFGAWSTEVWLPSETPPLDGDAPVYINTSHFGLENPRPILDLKQEVAAKVVIFIHDLIPIQYPQFVRTGHDGVHAQRLKTVSTAADAVIVNSDATGNSLAEYFAVTELDCPDLHTLRIGVEEHFACEATDVSNPGRAEPRFVVLGTIEPRKNHRLLLDVWRDLVASHGSAPQLIVVGKRGWNNQETFARLDNLGALEPFVEERNDVPDDDLVEVLKTSRALLMPSFAEGWGMPVVEALTLGVPVVASDIDAHAEASSGAAVLLNPHDTDAWTQAVTALWFGRDQQPPAPAATSFTPPSWQDHFLGVERIISDMG